MLLEKLKKSGYLIPIILIALALSAYIGYFIIYNIYAVALFRFPFDYDQGEGFELVDTLLFSRGQWPYRDNNVYPFYSSNYPPVFHLVIMPLVWIFGPRYWTGRVVSYLGTLITSVAIGYAVQRKIKRKWLSLIAGLAYLSSNYIYHVGPLFRQHLFMVMFETVAVVWVAITIEKEEETGIPQTKSLMGIMLLLLLAGYTKQLAYATVITIFLFLFLRNWRRSIRWAIPFGMVTGIIFLLLNLATDGQWYIATVTANINEFVDGQAIGLMRQWYTLHAVLIVTSFIYALYQLYFSRLSVYSIWFVLTAINGCLTAGKWGAGESYFATAIAASCILMGLGFGRILTKTTPHPRIHALTLSLLALLLLNQANRTFHMPTHTPLLRTIAEFLNKPTVVYVSPQTSCSPIRPIQIVPYVDTVGPTLLGRPPSSADKAAGLRILDILSNDSQYIFSEEAAFNLWHGRAVITNPTQLLNLYKNDQVDLSQMLAMIEKKSFDAVLFRAQLYPQPVLNAIGQHYHQTEQIQMNGFVYCILKPNE